MIDDTLQDPDALRAEIARASDYLAEISAELDLAPGATLEDLKRAVAEVRAHRDAEFAESQRLRMRLVAAQPDIDPLAEFLSMLCHKMALRPPGELPPPWHLCYEQGLAYWRDAARRALQTAGLEPPA